MKKQLRVKRLAGALAILLMTSPVYAQQTSSNLAGRVTDNEGAPLAGAEVIIVHTPSGTTSRAVTDAQGRYTARGLRVGGPYQVTVTRDGFRGESNENVFLSLGETSALNMDLDADATSLEAIQVVASTGSMIFSQENTGVGTSVDGRQLDLIPLSSRSIDDVARLDPRVSVIDQASGSISVAGVNNRYNTISVDGLSQGDPFGLNSNGMPYTGSPISVDTIEAYDIKVSDYDVAADTVGATINAVTKSGTNEFHGSLYYVYKDAENMVGSRDGQDYNLFDTDITKGLTFGGPLLKDRLFFFGSYEEQTIKDFGGASSTDAFSRGAITQAEIDQVIDIARNVWGIDPGVYGNLGVNLENKRYLGKLDWNISDNHRASLTYQQTEENRPSPYNITNNSVALSSRWYNIDNITKNTSFQLFSDWTTNFSTEFKVSHQKFDQENGNAFNDGPAINVGTANIVATSDSTGIAIGEDRNRHENKINTERLSVSLFGTYYAANHTIKGGFDYQEHDVLNLYGRDLHGVYTFASIEDFAAGNYSNYSVRRPVGGFSEADTAAALVYEQFSPYIQDTWQATDNLSMTFGVRINIPKADKAPPRHPTFEQTFGFPNDYKLGSDNKIVMPRFSFNYQFDTERYSQLRGGVGVFQSIPPFVWMANPYQNNGVTAAAFNSSNPDLYPFSPDPYNQPIPDDLSVSGLAQMDVIDPDFKLPSVYKISLGYDAELPWYGLIGTVEYQQIQAKDAVFYQALNIGEAQGTLADGRASYWCTMGAGNSNSNKNCGAVPGFNYNSTLLGNTNKGKSSALTLALTKPMSDNWFGSISYTFTDAKEVASDGSSQAWSSYQYVSRINPNQEFTTTAGRQVRDSFKATLGWERAFFGDYRTSASLFYTGHSGLPYTWTFNGDANGDRIFQDPAYIPLLNDPIVSYGNATAEQIAAFQAFIDSNEYLRSHRGQIAGRHADRYPWVNQFDVSFQQELPGFMEGHKSILRLDIYNIGNMIKKSWGQTYGGTFSDNTRQLAGLVGVNADGTYTYNLGSPNSPTWQELQEYDASSAFPSRLVSRWSAMLTLRYEF